VYIEFYQELNPAAGHIIARFNPVNRGNRRPRHIIARCSEHAVPPMLHANAEARAIALQHFHLLGTGSSQIHFNPEVDTLMLSALFRVDDTKLCDRPATIFGSNVALVRHIAYNQAEPYHMGWCLPPKFIEAFSGALESFTFLDLTEWERAFCLADQWEEMRAALGNKVFRPENLVALDRRQLPILYDSLLFVWGRISQRPLDVKVMGLPVPRGKLEELRERQETEKQRKAQGWFGVWGLC
jgi:hypothetical protein